MSKPIWTCVQLGDVAEIIMGQAPAGDTVSDQGPGVPFLQGNAEFGTVNPTSELFCSHPQKVCAPEDTLISVRAPVGALNIADQRYAIGRGLAAIRFKGINVEYGRHSLRLAISQLSKVAQGTTFAAVGSRELADIKFEIPVDPHEQQRVAGILDSADENITVSQSVIGKLASVSSALIADRLTRLTTSAPEVRQLDDVADVLSGVTLGSEPGGSGSVEIPYLRVANVQDGYVDTTEMKTIRILRSDLPKYLLRSGDVLLTEGGDLDKLGRGTMWDGRIPECICQNHIFRVRCDESRVLPGYLSLYIGSPMGKAYFLKIAKQTTNLASINSTQLKQMPLPIPGIDDQVSLIELMASSQSKVETERQRLSQLQQLKQGLMDDLLTGRVRVPVG